MHTGSKSPVQEKGCCPMSNISVIVPVYNGGAQWRRALDSLLQLAPHPLELVVVDDGSTDGSGEYAQARGARLLQTPRPRSGPAVARNLGAARANGEILWFIDSDVMVYPESLSLVASAFDEPQVSAIFGSYDDSPRNERFLSQYRNLLHHYVHQTSNSDASSF